ncbi:uncharacterized protein LOC128669627 isoform X2 [Plodia interpunctella]|nr:uncharacterized protein LOC128669627 isoform X2 [Plodia interpunctella]XP_053600534.1 uncharacterized protein LOC128669627 isoform X2 [Plodia interpunctella]XP_053600535.1 uncharacterized protein LOC128669627 isoform X2 [Plodia interpunctella]
MTFMLEFMHFSCIMHYFSLRMRFLNAIILNHIKDEFTLISFTLTNEMMIKQSAAEAHDFKYCNIDIYLKELIHCFYKFQNLYQYQILIFFMRLFFSCIFYIHFVIVAVNDNTTRGASNTIYVILCSIDFILILMACTRCETFFREAQLLKHFSIVILSIYHDGPLRKKAKRIFKILEENPPIFSVYHMWNLKHETVVQLAGVLTTVFFNILQFHYL